MDKSFSESYKDAGVDITKGYKAVDLMKEHIAKTLSFGDTEEIGGFGGLFGIGKYKIEDPVLVSGTDGVGTKLRIAFQMDKHDTVGIDCVAMCVNDIICAGAMPLFFLDYIACGKNEPEKIADIVKGVSDGCVQASMALIGGETAEMPGSYPPDEYDLAGFAVGIVPKSKILDKTRVRAGDLLIALPSSGLHSNGFSLVRKVLETENRDLFEKPFGLAGKTLGETLIEPTKIYVKPVLDLIRNIDIQAISNITGGGFYENIPRSLPPGIKARIRRKDIRIPPIFEMIQEEGNIPERDMFNTFNMGVGMVIIVKMEDAEKTLDVLEMSGEDAYIIGETIDSDYDCDPVEIV